jgi:hypothetical protein
MATFTTKKEAVAFVGGLSGPSKMPCDSWNIPADKCDVGMKLRAVKGTVCSVCYAKKGRYPTGTVKNALARRLQLWEEDRAGWRDAMVHLIQGKSHFRFFDSGDLQGEAMLADIVEIARRCPETGIWLPTREYALVRKFFATNERPENLIVRVSAPRIDGAPPAWWPLTSTVHKTKKPIGFKCPAPDNENKCGGCRACWDPKVTNVSYSAH